MMSLYDKVLIGDTYMVKVPRISTIFTGTISSNDTILAYLTLTRKNDAAYMILTSERSNVIPPGKYTLRITGTDRTGEVTTLVNGVLEFVTSV